MNSNDKNGKPLRVGMYLRFDGGSVEVIYFTADACTTPDIISTQVES